MKLKNIHITESNFWYQVNIWNQGKKLQDLHVKTTANMLDWCNIWPFIMISWTTTIFISKIII